MRLRVRHHTRYAYERPTRDTAQVVRLFPRAHAGLEVARWRVTGPLGTALSPHLDGHGNLVAFHDVARPVAEVPILAEGEVETRDLSGRLSGLPEALPASFFLRQTRRTTPNDQVFDLAASIGAPALTRAWAQRLMEAVLARVAFAPGVTDVGSTAAEALATGAGVCQDHAHVFLACARAVGLPARYVSGYLWTGRGVEPASHAWVEAFVDEGWTGLDPANSIFAGERHVRLASGLDYDAAAPISGVRRGGGVERLEIGLAVLSSAEQ